MSMVARTDVLGQRLAHSDGVAQHQVSLELAQLVAGHLSVAQHSVAGVHAVHGAAIVGYRLDRPPVPPRLGGSPAG